MNRVLIPPRRAPPHDVRASCRPHLPKPSLLDVRSLTCEFWEGTNTEIIAASYFNGPLLSHPVCSNCKYKVRELGTRMQTRSIGGSVPERGSQVSSLSIAGEPLGTAHSGGPLPILRVLKSGGGTAGAL